MKQGGLTRSLSYAFYNQPNRDVHSGLQESPDDTSSFNKRKGSKNGSQALCETSKKNTRLDLSCNFEKNIQHSRSNSLLKAFLQEKTGQKNYQQYKYVNLLPQKKSLNIFSRKISTIPSKSNGENKYKNFQHLNINHINSAPAEKQFHTKCLSQYPNHAKKMTTSNLCSPHSSQNNTTSTSAHDDKFNTSKVHYGSHSNDTKKKNSFQGSDLDQNGMSAQSLSLHQWLEEKIKELSKEFDSGQWPIIKDVLNEGQKEIEKQFNIFHPEMWKVFQSFMKFLQLLLTVQEKSLTQEILAVRESHQNEIHCIDMAMQKEKKKNQKKILKLQKNIEHNSFQITQIEGLCFQLCQKLKCNEKLGHNNFLDKIDNAISEEDLEESHAHPKVYQQKKNFLENFPINGKHDFEILKKSEISEAKPENVCKKKTSTKDTHEKNKFKNEESSNFSQHEINEIHEEKGEEPSRDSCQVNLTFTMDQNNLTFKVTDQKNMTFTVDKSFIDHLESKLINSDSLKQSNINETNKSIKENSFSPNSNDKNLKYFKSNNIQPNKKGGNSLKNSQSEAFLHCNNSKSSIPQEKNDCIHQMKEKLNLMTCQMEQIKLELNDIKNDHHLNDSNFRGSNHRKSSFGNNKKTNQEDSPLLFAGTLIKTDANDSVSLKKIKNQDMAVKNILQNDRRSELKLKGLKKKKNQAKLIIQQIMEDKKETLKPKFTALSLKHICQLIHQITHEKFSSSKSNIFIKEQPLSDFSYDYFFNVFGFTSIAEQKFNSFCDNLKKNKHILKISLFNRFIGLCQKGCEYTNDEVNVYIDAKGFMENTTNLVIDNEFRVLVPFTTAIEYLKHKDYQKKMSESEYFELKKFMQNLRLPDPKGVMKSFFIDFDLFIEKIIFPYNKVILLRTRENVKHVFDASLIIHPCTLKENYIDINAFILICRYIEKNKFDFKKTINIFQEFADIDIGENTFMTLDRFVLCCSEVHLFTEEKQNEFLGISSSNELEGLCNLLIHAWNNIKEEVNKKLTECNFHLALSNQWKTGLKIIESRLNSASSKDKFSKASVLAIKLLDKELSRLLSSEDDDYLSNDYRTLTTLTSVDFKNN